MISRTTRLNASSLVASSSLSWASADGVENGAELFARLQALCDQVFAGDERRRIEAFWGHAAEEFFTMQDGRKIGVGGEAIDSAQRQQVARVGM